MTTPSDCLAKATEMVQANVGEPALSEKVNGPAEWLPIETAPKDGTSVLISGGTYRYSGYTFPKDEPYKCVAKATWVDDEWFGGFGSEYDESYSHSPTHWMPLPPPPGAELNFSNEPERAAVSLKQTSSVNGIDALREENLRLREALKTLADAVELERRNYEEFRRLFNPNTPIPADSVIDSRGDVFDAAYLRTNEAVKKARAAFGGEQK